MPEQSRLKPLAIALGTTLASALSFGSANAAENPFGQSELSSGYMVAENEAAKPVMEGKCGAMGDKTSATMPRCDMKTLDADADGKVTKEEFNKHHNAMFTKMDANGDGSLDASETGKMMEGKCGEGKCGAGMKK